MKSAAAAITPVMVSMPELMMRPAAKAVAVTAMATSTTTSSRPNPPGAAFDLEVMALHFGSGRSPQGTCASRRYAKRQA